MVKLTMIKKVTKLIAGCIIASMLPLVPVTASASTVCFTEDFEGGFGWKKSDWIDWQPDLYKAYTAKGKFGKANSDSALIVEATNVSSNYNGKSYGVSKSISLRDMTNGEKLHISFEYLASDFNGTKNANITLKSDSDESKTFTPVNYSKRWRDGSKVSYFSSSVEQTYESWSVQLNTWYKYDFFIDSSDNSVSIYRNGSLLGNTTLVFDGGGSVKNITEINFFNQQPTITNGSYFAVDNINIEYVSTVNTPAVQKSNAFIDFQFIAPNTGAINANSKAFLDCYDADNKVIPVSAGNYVKREGSGYADVIRYETEENIFGKTGRSLHMFNNAVVNTGHAYIQTPEIALGNGDKALISYEVAIDPNNNYHQRYGARITRSVNGDVGEYELMQLQSNKNLAICGQWVATLKNDRWYKIDLVIDSATAKVTAYLNGRKVLDGYQPSSWALASGEYISRIFQNRFQYYPTQGSEMPTGGVYYDNILLKNLGKVPEYDAEDYTVSYSITGDGSPITYATEDGVFGKNNVLHMYNATATSGTAQITIPEIGGLVAGGDKVLISYEVATDPNNACQQRLYARAARAKDGTVTDWGSDTELMLLNSTGGFKFFGSEWVSDLAPGRWYKIDIVIDTATAEASVYINGEEKISNFAVSRFALGDGEYIPALHRINFVYWPSNSIGGVYYHNINTRKLGNVTFPDFDTPLTVSEFGCVATVDTVTVMPETDVAGFLASSSANSGEISAVNSAGAAISSGVFPSGSKILVTSPYGDDSVYDVDIYDRLTLTQSGSTVTAEFNGTDQTDGVLVLAIYKGNELILNKFIYDDTAAANVYECSTEVTVESGMSARAFFWDNFVNINALCNYKSLNLN